MDLALSLETPNHPGKQRDPIRPYTNLNQIIPEKLRKIRSRYSQLPALHAVSFKRVQYAETFLAALQTRVPSVNRLCPPPELGGLPAEELHVTPHSKMAATGSRQMGCTCVEVGSSRENSALRAGENPIKQPSIWLCGAFRESEEVRVRAYAARFSDQRTKFSFASRLNSVSFRSRK
ncbi:uncharacterized protein LOC116664116 isoform X3 [Camelus ferus]|uniref:Uncharacterized protein LOC116664116 isoform X3 n=1 Tax=Camelus ferus TaxID=419612 RepID=A0A8B8T577_CAMFR|nr:uncharacterized protein LOC116664116 isoform X3 [Camelus ferus]